MKPFRICLVILSVVALQSQALAQRTFEATITHDQETGVAGQTPLVTSGPNPMSRPLSFGSAVFTLNAAMTSLSFVATIFNIDVTGLQTPNDLNDNLTAAHIHAGALTGQRGTTAGVVWGFFGSPFNDNNPNDAMMTPFVSGVGGIFSGKWDLTEGNGTTLAAQLANIFAERAYINFHTVQFPGGEIRGQIVPDAGSSALLLGLAVTGLVLARAQTRRARV
jgi:hypothetical protein